MSAASLVYAVRMSESYDIRCRVGTRQIVAPIGAGEARIPALVRLRDERLILFFDERPAPASGTGADFNGLTMASDLSNPNRIRTESAGWSAMGAVVGRIRVSCRRVPRRLVGRLRGVRRRRTHAPGVRRERGAVGFMDSRAGGSVCARGGRGGVALRS